VLYSNMQWNKIKLQVLVFNSLTPRCRVTIVIYDTSAENRKLATSGDKLKHDRRELRITYSHVYRTTFYSTYGSLKFRHKHGKCSFTRAEKDHHMYCKQYFIPCY
jgi:hypothetical protein